MPYDSSGPRTAKKPKPLREAQRVAFLADLLAVYDKHGLCLATEHKEFGGSASLYVAAYNQSWAEGLAEARWVGSEED